MNVPYTVELLDKLRKNAHLNKHSHFEASKRYRFCHVLIGVPMIIINLVLGTVYVYLNDPATAIVSRELVWGMAAIAFIGASLSAIQTFFKFQKTFESHRSVANQYLAVARECDIAIASYCDNPDTDLDKLKLVLEKLNMTYVKINKDAETLPTSDKDYQKSLVIQRGKEDAEQSVLESYQLRLNPEVAE